MSQFGRLTQLQLREYWTDEASDFTPWLAEEENIALVGDSIGLNIEVEAQEHNVGPFSADILCRDIDTENWVLIENQLESTDHKHLGQLLTYAAGLDAVTIVWIAKSFTDEHRAALDWLNRITDEAFSFFGLEIELWQIGDSAVAPKLNMISHPNDWQRTISRTVDRGLITRLAVTMPGGETIDDKVAADTFVKVIKELGVQEIKDLNIEVNGRDLISTVEYPNQQQRKLDDGHYINVNTSTKVKRNLLEDIASRLDINLQVEIIPR